MYFCTPLLLDLDSFCNYLRSAERKCPYKSLMIFSVLFSLLISEEKSCFKGLKISDFFFKFCQPWLARINGIKTENFVVVVALI